jgi:hypothetical protein
MISFDVQKINSKKILRRTLDSGLDLEIEKKMISIKIDNILLFLKNKHRKK